MSAHTSGPWHSFCGRDAYAASFATVRAKKGAVAIYDAPLTLETEANAHLIAAAPDLLDALRMLAGVVENLAPYRPEVAEGVLAMADIAHAAISKATGGKP